MAEDKRERKVFEPPPWERDAFEELRRAREAGEHEEQIAEAVEELRSGQEELPTPAVDDDHVQRMLFELAAEEPRGLGRLWILEVAVAAFMALLGLTLLVWSLVGLARAGAAQNPGVTPFAFVMTVFGAAFIAMGIWLGRRGLRGRGVL